jgi:hypothetical protein
MSNQNLFIMKNNFLVMVIFIFIFFGCNKDKDTGTLSVYLIDAPAAYEKVLVDVQGLKINVSDTDDEDGWQDLELNTTGQIDLLSLTDGNSIWLTDEKLPVGNIAQMRLLLGSNNQIVVNGETHELETPSAQQSGLKFKINATIEEDKTYVLYIDFDAEKSIAEKGNGTYSLKPVITVKTEEEVQEEQGE